MPGRNGLEIQHELASRRPLLPIIFVSAQTREDVQARALANGAWAFLPKPFRDEDLLAAIDSALKRHPESLSDHML
jgi:FixJ family two-component response regulator